MGIEAILAQIEVEAAAESARIGAEARERSAQLVAGAEATATALVEAASERAEPGTRAEATRLVNATRLRLLERRAGLAAAGVEAVFAGAAARLETIVDGRDETRWSRALGRLAEEATALAGTGAVVTIERHGPAAGVMARSGDGRIEVDATISARLERARVRLAEPVAEILGLAG
jgi:vacuolar-type H+-ATPase subunit E/Vma4